MSGSADRIPTLVVPIPARENTHAKALRYLLEGRLVIRYVDDSRVLGHVRGDTGVYRVGFAHGLWSCTCSVCRRRLNTDPLSPAEN